MLVVYSLLLRRSLRMSDEGEEEEEEEEQTVVAEPSVETGELSRNIKCIMKLPLFPIFFISSGH